jgi:CheY-like chemotaxis protein
MARILDHELSAESWPGRGSRFAIRVPIESAAAISAAQARAPRTPADSLPPNLHVLCLDNDAAILDGMVALLSRWHVGCQIAGTVDEACVALRRRRPDLILADYHLDDAIDGLAALDRLCAEAGIPGALITADTSPDLKLQARQRGYPVLQKPVRPAALRAVIAHLTRGVETAVAD